MKEYARGKEKPSDSASVECLISYLEALNKLFEKSIIGKARGIFVTSQMKRPDLDDLLTQVLGGVTRVPALLLTNPTQQLSSLNLEKYAIVACEPLHDLKGHLINLITELPSILPPGETKIKCDHLIDNCLSKQKKSGADLRRVVIQLFLLLKDTDCSSRIFFLLQSVIKIGEIAYSRDDKRNPRALLQLYNMCWSCARTS